MHSHVDTIREKRKKDIKRRKLYEQDDVGGISHE